MTKKLAIGLAIAIITCSAYLWSENNLLSSTKYEISDIKIPTSFNGFKILQLSDIHNTRSQFLQNRIVERVYEQNPEIIVITGDVVDRRSQRIDIVFGLIERIKDVSPIYYINGNHESDIDNYDQLVSGLKEMGVVILDNQTTTIEKNGESILLAGLRDPSFYKNTSWYHSVKTSAEELQNNNELYSILLAHRPEYINLYSAANFDLVLAGHAHGGQIRIPFVGGMISPGEGWWPKMTNGVHKLNNTQMVISRGIGNSAFPFRINNRPEIVCIELKNK